jgi:predicted MFS family arabinose efflux permease
VPIDGLLIAAVVLGGFFLRQQSVAREPVLPLTLLANPVIRMTSILGFMVMVIYVGASVYVPLYLEFVRGMSADTSGMVLIALMIGVVGGALISGQYMRFLGRYKLPPMIGVACAGIAWAYMALNASARTDGEIIVVLTIAGIGLGTAFPSMMVATQNAAAGGNLGIATANHAFFRSLGGAVGVSLFSAIILSMLAAHLGEGQGTDLNDILKPGPVLDAVQPYLGKAFGMFFGTAAALCAASAIGFVFLKELPLRQHASGAAPEIAAE